MVVYEAVKSFADSGNSKKQIITSEERYYLRHGKLFRWVGGMSNDKSGIAPSSLEFADAAECRLAASAAFQAATLKAMAVKLGSK